MNVTVRPLNSTSLLVTWGSMRSSEENGIVLGFRVLYKKASLSPTARKRRAVSDEATVLIFNRNVTAAELHGLEEFTTYCVQVLAFTRKGDGEPNECLYSKTADIGKVNAIFDYFIFIYYSLFIIHYLIFIIIFLLLFLLICSLFFVLGPWSLVLGPLFFFSFFLIFLFFSLSISLARAICSGNNIVNLIKLSLKKNKTKI